MKLRIAKRYYDSTPYYVITANGRETGYTFTTRHSARKTLAILART